MKLFRFLAVAVLFLGLMSCVKYEFEVDYTAPVSISFQGVGEDNIITLGKGVYSYDATVEVSSSIDLSEIVVSEADNRTGVAGKTIEEYVLTDGVKEKTFTVGFDELVDNAAIRVTVTDVKGATYAKNLVVAITPSVIVNDALYIETAEVYYGCYYASWLGGRAYLRSTDNVENYKKEIDLAFAEVNGMPCAVSPASRSTVSDLPNLGGLKSTAYALTDISAAEYDAITKVDASPIKGIPEPTGETVELVNGKVYVFKTADGKKGLFKVESLADKTATVEVLPDEEHSANWWKEGYSYRLLSISAKIMAE